MGSEPKAPLPTQALLATAIADADEIVVTAPVSKEVLGTIRGSSIGQEFLKQVQIDEAATSFHCMCYGDGWIEFTSKGVHKAQISFHHAVSLRWLDGPWASDAALVGDSGLRLSRWFEAKGVSVFEENRKRMFALAEAREKKAKDFWGQLPEGLQQVISANDGRFDTEIIVAREALAKSPDRPAWIAAIFRAFGQVPLDLTGYDSTMLVAREFIENADSRDIEVALRRVASDDVGFRGAAFAACQWPLMRKIDPRVADAWGPRFGDFILSNASDYLKPEMLLRLSSLSGENVTEFLVEIASGKRAYGYALHLKKEENSLGVEPPPVPFAILALARKHDPRTAQFIEAAQKTYTDRSSVAALDVAKALVAGKPTFDPNAFSIGSFVIGYGGLQVLENLPPNEVPAAHLAAALKAPWGAVNDRAALLAAKFELGKLRDRVFETDPQGGGVSRTLAWKNPSFAIEICTEKLPTAKPGTQAHLLHTRGLAHLQLGQNAAAYADFEASNDIGRQLYRSENEKLIAAALWHAGEYKRAIKFLGSSRGDTYAEQGRLEARGLAFFAAEEFGEADADLAKIATAYPFDFPTAALQHAASILMGKPHYSLLQRSVDAIQEDMAQLFAPNIVRFLAGQISAEELISRAGRRTDAEDDPVPNQAAALFYVSLRYRLSHNDAEERQFLQRCIEMKQLGRSEHWLAVARLAKLGAYTRPAADQIPPLPRDVQ